MDIARALTKRVKTRTDPHGPGRSHTVKHGASVVDLRSKISAPVELLSTTNMLSYNAPDIPRSKSSKSLSGSSHSGSDFEGSLNSTPATSPDASSIDEPPSPNNFSCEFSNFTTPTLGTSVVEETAPAIPSRAPSHTKRTHTSLARARSLSRMRSSTDLSSESTPHTSHKHTNSIQRNSAQMFCYNIEEIHPFGNELEQVQELVEEFGIKKANIFEEDEKYMIENGLSKYSVQEYLVDLEPLSGVIFTDLLAPPKSGDWF